MRGILVAAGLILSASVLPAIAADVVTAPEIVEAPQSLPEAYSWSGFYAGAQLGYAEGKSTWRNHDYTDGYVEGTDISPDGFVGGVYLGANAQLAGNFVAGVEADVNLANIDGHGGDYTQYFAAAPSAVLAGVETSASMKWNGALRARMGFAADRFLPYLAGGLSFGGYEFNARYNGQQVVSVKDTLVGWNIAAGAEYAATDRLLFRVEYRYTDFGKASFDNIWNEEQARLDLKSQDLRFGVAVKF